MPERILIVADDLTGACDGAAAFAAAGRTVRVFLDAAQADEMEGRAADVVAVTTESRDLAPDQAAACVAGAIGLLLSLDAGGLLFKKIDSAARGPFAAEIEAALDASRASLALVTPAFPAAGRTVANGALSVRDLSGQNTGIVLPDLFAAGATARLAALPPSDEAALHRAVVRAVEAGVRILLCDAIVQQDLDRLAAAALRIPERILWAGSAGLARSLAAQMQVGRISTHGAARISRRTGRAVLFAGSPHPVTALQVAHLEQVSSNDSPHRRAIHRIVESDASREAIVSVFGAASPAGIILTGGDTAAFVLRVLEARAIRLTGEIAPGMPWGIVEGGVADGCTVVTKSGGFGERDALVCAFDFCESEV